MTEVLPSLSIYGPDLVGVLMPPLIEILNKDIPEEKTTERFMASLALCFVVALVLRWNELMIGSAEQVLTTFGLIFTESQIVYKTYFKDSFIRAKIKEKFQPSNYSDEDNPLG